MIKQEAERIASLFLERWPAGLVQPVIRQTAGDGYKVIALVPRERRRFTMSNPRQVAGALDAVAMILETPEQASGESFPSTEAEKEETMIQEETPPTIEVSTPLSEEEAAAYLGIKQSSLRTYVTDKTLKQQDDGSFTLEELRRYKEAREARWGKPRRLAPGATKTEQPPGEAQLLQGLIAHVFAQPGVVSLGRLSEAPRSWKVDVITERGPESYRVTRNIDGSWQQERW